MYNPDNQSDLINADPASSSKEITISELFVHEWLAIAIILGILGLLTFCALFGRLSTHSNIETHKGLNLTIDTFEVRIEGAVAKPGIYKVKKGTSIEKAILQAEPLPVADLSKIRSTSKVRNGQNIVVNYKPTILIHVQGAAKNEGEYTIPKGTRLFALKDFIELSDDADLNKMNRKRILKNGETVVIPVRVN